MDPREEFGKYLSFILLTVFPKLIPVFNKLKEGKSEEEVRNMDASFMIFDSREEATPYDDIARILNLPDKENNNTEIFTMILSPVSTAMELIAARKGADLRDMGVTLVGLKSFHALLANGVDIEKDLRNFPNFWLFRGKTFFHISLYAEESGEVPSFSTDELKA